MAGTDPDSLPPDTKASNASSVGSDSLPRKSHTCAQPAQAAQEFSHFTQGELAFSEEVVRLARELSQRLFQEARSSAQYRRVLGQRERIDQFAEELTQRAQRINESWARPLSDNVVRDVARRMASRVTTWKHDPEQQRQRQRKQVAARRRGNRGRDAQIIYYADAGESQRDIARRFGISRNAVRNVLKRDADKRVKARVKEAAERPAKVLPFRPEADT